MGGGVMDAVIVTLLLGLVTGIGTGIMALHVSANIRDHRDRMRMQSMLDDLYPFLHVEDIELLEQQEDTIKNEKIAV